MNRSRDVLKKVIIIYLIAAVVVVFLYLRVFENKRDNATVTYEFEQDDNYINSALKIEGTEEIGDTSISQSDTDETLNNADSAATEETLSETATDKHYYKYTTTNKYNQLRVRTGPDLNEAIIDKIAPGTTGYVLEKGDGWSYIRTKNTDGYSSNSYLSFEEIGFEQLPDDFPEEYK